MTAGEEYHFTVTAIGVNGDGVWYDAPEAFHSCVAPSQMQAPARVTSTVNSITVSWAPPPSNGGCDILSYAVFVDDGANGSYSEVNTDNDPQVRNLPGL